MLVAICIIVTSLLVPILTGLWYRQFGQGMAEKGRADDPMPALHMHPAD